MIKEILTRTKQNREKLLIFSIPNSCYSKLYKDLEIVRFDIDEFAFINGFKDEKRVEENDIIPVVSTIEAKILIVDVPLYTIYSGDSFDLGKIVDYYRNTRADILALNIDYVAAHLLKRLTDIDIPVIVYSRNKKREKELDIENLLHNFKEVEANKALLLILENYPPKFINEMNKSLSIPIVTDIRAKTDGFYAKFTSVFGLKEDDSEHSPRYLNIMELLKEGIKDCTVDNSEL